jgi:hypothetical protein
MVYNKYSGSGKFSSQQLKIMDDKRIAEEARIKESKKQRELKEQQAMNEELNLLEKYINNPEWITGDVTQGGTGTSPIRLEFRKTGTNEKVTVEIKHKSNFDKTWELIRGGN